MSMWAKQSLRLFRHELKRGELTIIAFAIILAVATVFSLSGFSERIESALVTKSNSFIAADRILQSSKPVSDEKLEQANSYQLEQAQQLLFSSMVFAGDEMLLGSVKAVSDNYPLIGELIIEKDNQSLVNPTLTPGNIWVAPALLTKMGVKVGDTIELGAAMFTISGVIIDEPDASFSVFTRGPRVLLNIADVEKTKVIQPGSRLTYRYLFAGDDEQLDSYHEWLKPNLTDSERWRDIKSQQSPLANALNRAEKYLSLASMLGIILAAVAVSVASRRYGQRHKPMVAVFKAMGANTRYITKLYFLHWSSLAAVSITIGLVIGYGLQQIGMSFMTEYLPDESTSLSMHPFIVATVTGVICATAFAVAPIRDLIGTEALSVIRGFKQQSSGHAVISNIPAFIAIFALLYLFSNDWFLSVGLIVAGLIVIGVIMLLASLLVNLGRKVGSQAGQGFHLAMANLKRRGKQNNVQLVSFTISVMLLLLMLVVRNDLINEWQQQLPDDVPNQFMVNINKQQLEPVATFLETQQLAASDLYPIVRGRLVAINDEQIAKETSKEETDKSDQGRQGIGRELSLTWLNNLPKNNTLVSGSWFDENDNKPQVSIESQVAERLDIKLGDELSFNIGSKKFTVPVTSIREVDWQSMQPNFYMIFSPDVLEDFPSTYIASVHVPAENKQALQRFMSQYPTISVIDVDAMINQLKSVIEQVSLAVEFILALVLIAGSLVLFAQVQASMEERERELAILRTLGAKGRLLTSATVLEFVLLGLIAGFLGAVAMEVGVYVIQSKVFDMEVSWHYQYWILGMVCGAVFVGLLGLIACWRLLKLSSLTLIKRTL